jgi:AAA domain
MSYPFKTVDATRDDILIRAGLCGPAGSGKTYSALLMGTMLVELLGFDNVWLIDSENRSSLKYAYSEKTGRGFHFKVVFLPPDNYSPTMYMDALEHCESQGARLIIIDSLSHAWNGTNGVLEQVDQFTKRSRSKNAFTEGWREMSPVQNKLIQRILSSPAHILLTLRAKVDWVVGDNEQGKKAPTKVGMAPIQREGVDYEPDLMFDLSVPENRATVSKTRCDRIGPGEVFDKPGFELSLRLAEWVHDEDLPRNLDAATERAIARGVHAAARGEQGRREYVAVRDQLAAWCRAWSWASGVHRAAPIDEILARFKSGVVARQKPMNGVAGALGDGSGVAARAPGAHA